MADNLILVSSVHARSFYEPPKLPDGSYPSRRSPSLLIFAIPPNVPPDQVVAAIERDRLQMAKRPGMRQKHLPVRIDAATGNFLSGGRYLFDTFEHAEQFNSSPFLFPGLQSQHLAS